MSVVHFPPARSRGAHPPTGRTQMLDAHAAAERASERVEWAHTAGIMEEEVFDLEK